MGMSRVFYRKIGHKQKNDTWVGQGKHANQMVRCSQFEPKKLGERFFLNQQS